MPLANNKILEPGEGADLLGESLRTEPVARRQVPLCPGLAQLLQGGGQVAGIVRRIRGTT